MISRPRGWQTARIVEGFVIRHAQVSLFGVRVDGTPVKLPPVRVRPGGYPFLRDGTRLSCATERASYTCHGRSRWTSRCLIS